MGNLKRLTLIAGDGIGPEITEQVIRVLKKVAAPFEYEEQKAGLSSLEDCGELLPQATIESLKTNRLALKGPTTTPVGGGHKSINVTLRQMFNLYANVRPVRSLPGVRSLYSDADLVIVRENTEGMYIGEEQMVDEDTAESLKRITRVASMRICRYAFELAQRSGRKKVTCVHKANIMKLSDGLFLQCFADVARDFPEVEATDMIVDNCCMQLVTNPQQFEVIVTANLYGDILSDLGAGLIGGLGVIPGGNIGQDMAVFEAVHGSAPDIAGQNKANPTALLQSSIMLLEHIGEHEKAHKILMALKRVLSEPELLTGDLGGQGTTSSFTDEILKHL